MLIDFAMLPPEVNSVRMYAGPGAGPLQAAAATWAGLSADLQSTAKTYGSVVSELTGLRWQGPSSASMATAVTPYVEWLTTTAAQVQQTATQATAAVAAFEQAFAMTVPPPVIAANRAQLAALVATNLFGQNTAAIAATEAAYAEMWAQDATAMYDYAATSAAAATLTPFASPQQSTNPDGLTAQSAAVTKAAASSAANPLTVLSQLPSTLSEELQAIPIVPDDFSALDGILGVYATVTCTSDITSVPSMIIGAEASLGLFPGAAAAAAPEAAVLAPVLSSVNTVANAVSGGGLSAGMGPGGPVSAVLSSAGSVGRLSVPPVWAAPAVTTVRAFEATPFTTVQVGNAAASGMPGMPGMPLPGTGRGGLMSLPRYGLKLAVMARPLSGG